ncbi:Putative glycoside hydrolase, family 35, glycoside hydrolase, family 42 [Septoria linicola]|uniref:Glycoside hydrolase, family 35, glycoside hydrolase, family 42 n=1 Tax=Septoria linicola TaxID=215465 RepID=A0A9Q9B0V5_9PEZI|nr:putative glycoside hydrolase, family 35, glycoside hydrolase, family 42 [Septoria linicola]USW55251.1 Putative glycoside hydrolase, family 35, glycoside hydrolase, family 42 [Septoria linicola]
MPASIPHLRSTGNCQQLIVHDVPFLMLGGEVQKSQFSSASYMKEVWPKLEAANLNTVFGSVAWEQIEPVEDSFNFEELDRIILDARQHGLHLVLLWFGSFKNALSTYTPAWVKQNPARFLRAELGASDGKNKVADALSIFGAEAVKSDAKAFAALMRHIKEIDEAHSTVVMVQVENEVGLLGDSRDRSELAQQAWSHQSQAQLISIVQQDWPSLNEQIKSNLSGLQSIDPDALRSWDDIPGDKTQIGELFMAYHFAQYVETVAKAGRHEYPLPLYTNVWQNYGDDTKDNNVPNVVAGDDKPGDYPSGGGVTNVLDIWKLFAPSLALIGPDIFLNDYEASCAAYRHRDQGLLIPEQRRDEYGARRIWPAYGTHKAIGVAPFAIDTLSLEENPFARHYALLSKVSKQVVEALAGLDRSFGFFFDELHQDGSDPSPPQYKTFGQWDLTVERAHVFGKPSAGSGMIIHTTKNEFLLVGWGFQVSWRSTDPRACFNGLLKFAEKEVAEDGELKTLRLLNGDETRSGKVAIMPSPDPDYGGFPVAITIPARTGITLVEPYALFEDELEYRN